VSDDWLIDERDIAPGLSPGGFVEFGRTSARKDSRPAIHRITHDPARGPYHHELVAVDRAPFDRLHRDLQNPERLKARQARYERSESGRARSEAYGKSEKGRVRSARYDQSEKGRERTEEFATKKYLTRPIVAIDSEGRCPDYALDAKGRSPLTAWKEDGTISPHLKFDGQGNPWEPHEIHLIGAQSLDRPYQTPLKDALRQPALWIEPVAGQTRLSTDEIFDGLLSLPDKLDVDHPQQPIFVMFASMYDWTMWQIDVSFGRAYSIVKQRQFEPPCKRRQGYQFLGRWAVQMQPHRKLDIGELRWPNDPYGKSHRNHADYQKPAKGQTQKLQFLRKIRIYDCFRHSPKSFVKTITPLAKTGLISKDVFDRIKVNKERRGSFHKEDIDTVKEYTSDELHSLCVFMTLMRDAYWNALGIKLNSFHSPASAAAALLNRIGIRDKGNVQGHSWPVKSVNLDYEQIIAHHAYYGGRFECMYKGLIDYNTYNNDLASAYPYAMQSLPSMRGGRWEREKWPSNNIFERIEAACRLSIFKVSFNFPIKAPFYPKPYRTADGLIIFSSAGEGFYMRDDVLSAIYFCQKYKIDPATALRVEEANWFHPTAEALDDLANGRGPFAPIAAAFDKRIEFDQKDPGGPEQLAIKLIINSVYGKTAERIYRGEEDGEPIIPPHISPWYASAITAHTRLELMKAALLDPDAVLQFATDAVHSDKPLKLPRLKSEKDIEAGKEIKRLGDWTWKEVPPVLLIQSGLAFYLNPDRTVAEVKCRGLPLKDLSAATRTVKEIFEQWKRPYEGVSLGNKKTRSVKVSMTVFMPMTSAIVSRKSYGRRGHWGWVAKTIYLDDPGGKREIDPDLVDEMDLLAEFPMRTMPRRNPSPETISQLQFPDWVEDKEKEDARQKRATAQYFKLFRANGVPIDVDDADGLLIDNDTIEP
jgi:hypothetical protein